MKKECLESVRTGRLIILMLLFVLFGIMNPAIAKLTPWIMEMFADTMAESGLIITDVHKAYDPHSEQPPGQSRREQITGGFVVPEISVVAIGNGEAEPVSQRPERE